MKQKITFVLRLVLGCYAAIFIYSLYQLGDEPASALDFVIGATLFVLLFLDLSGLWRRKKVKESGRLSSPLFAKVNLGPLDKNIETLLPPAALFLAGFAGPTALGIGWSAAIGEGIAGGLIYAGVTQFLALMVGGFAEESSAPKNFRRGVLWGFVALTAIYGMSYFALKN